jgi:hypothetical protein
MFFHRCFTPAARPAPRDRSVSCQRRVAGAKDFVFVTEHERPAGWLWNHVGGAEVFARQLVSSLVAQGEKAFQEIDEGCSEVGSARLQAGMSEETVGALPGL